MAQPITIPNNSMIVPVNLTSSFKTVTLPVVSTNPGRILIFKDLYGNAANSTLRLSTIGLDRIELSNISSMVLSNAYGAWWFMNDGLTKWFLTDAYLNSLYLSLYTPPYVTSNLVYFLDAGNASSYPGSGSTWTDLMGTGKNITLYGSPTYSSSNGGYLSFVGASSQYGDTASSLPYMSNFTVETWIYYVSGSGGGCIVTETYPGTTGAMNYALGNVSGSWPNVQVAFYTGAWQATTGYALTSNNWYHIVGTYDGAALKVYVNNTLQASNANTTATQSNTGGFRLMRRWDFAEYVTGYLAIYRAYNRALTVAEVSQNFTGSRSRFGL